MNLILIRHAQAQISYPDESRELTRNGVKDFCRNCIELSKSISKIDLILSSPLTRAIQTGDLLAKIFEVEENYIEKTLSPGCQVNDIIDLADIYNVNTLACVFHLPDISYNFSVLCSTKSPNVYFNPGSIVVLSFDSKIYEGNGKLTTFIA